MIAAALCALILCWGNAEWRESNTKPFELVRVIVANFGHERSNKRSNVPVSAYGGLVHDVTENPNRDCTVTCKWHLNRVVNMIVVTRKNRGASIVTNRRVLPYFRYIVFQPVEPFGPIRTFDLLQFGHNTVGRAQAYVRPRETNSDPSLIAVSSNISSWFETNLYPWAALSGEQLARLRQRLGAVLSSGFEEREGGEEQERSERRQEASNGHQPYRVSRDDVFWIIGFPAILGAVIAGLAIYAVNKSVESRGRPREPEGDDWYG